MEANGFKVDNFSLTGESELKLNLLNLLMKIHWKTRNIGFFTTNSIEGTRVSMDVNIGDNTVMGKIAGLHLILILKTHPLPKRLLTSFTSSPVLLPFLELASSLLHLVLVTIGKCYLWISIIVANVQECILATVTVRLTLTA